MKMKNYRSIDGVFEYYYMTYAEQIENELSQIIEKQPEKKEYFTLNCHNDIVNQILDQIVRVSSLSLIDFYENNGKGNNNYKHTNESFLNKECRDAFHNKYPRVKIICNQIIENYINKFAEIVNAISKYEAEIYDFIKIQPFNKIDTLDFTKGDFHKNTFVVVLEICGKKLVLKKRNHIGERIIHVFYDEFKKENIILPIPEIEILDDDYHIQEYIEAGEGFSDSELETYYYKFGLMAGVFTILGSKDMHKENVIASKKGPCFIDMEAALTPKQYIGSYSLLKETLLFNINENGFANGNIDLSAFTGKNHEYECGEIVSKNQDDIHFSKVKKILVLKNTPLNIYGKEVNPMLYKNNVQLGYDDAFKIFLKRKENIIKKLCSLDRYDNRVVFRNTSFYGIYLNTLSLPLYMKSTEKTERLFSLLKTRSIRAKEIIEEEIDCLKKYIIPSFYVSRFISEKKIKEEFLERIRLFDKKDIEREKHYLKLALRIENNRFINYKTLDDRIEAEFEEYQYHCLIDDYFCYGTYDHTINDKILDYKNDLYTFGGALIFWLMIHPELKNKIEKTVYNGRKRKNISGLNGYHAGILLENKFGIDKSEKYLDAKTLMNSLDKVDFSTYGSSILVLDYLYARTGDKKYLNDICAYGEVYIKKIKDRKLTGMFHGYSGDMLVVGVLNKYLADRNYYQIIHNLIMSENSNYSSEICNWKDTRESSENNRDLVAISYGTVGVMLSRMMLMRDDKLPEKTKSICKKDINNAIDKILITSRSEYADDSLINGYAGALLGLKIAIDLGFINNNRKRRVNNYIKEGVSLLIAENWTYGEMTKIYNPAFASGRIGTLFAIWYIDKKGISI